MRLGIVVTPRDYPAACASGYDYVEMAGRSVAAMTDAQFDELKAVVLAGRLPCLGLNAYCPPEVAIIGSRFSAEAARAYAARLAGRAAQLGVRVVGVGSPMSRVLEPGYDEALAWRQAAAFFQETGRAFAPFGITVCIEALGPCYCNFINRLEEAKRLQDAVGEANVRLLADFYNMEHSGEADLPLADSMPRIAHAHISDDAGSPSVRSYLKPEKQAIHARRVGRLRQAGYSGNLTLEIDVPFDAQAAAESLAILQTQSE